MRGFAVAAIAIAGLLSSFTPAADRLDGLLLDLRWSILRKFEIRPAPDDIVIVGVDDATAASLREPPGLWNEPLGKALVRLASAHPRAIGFALPLPDRSHDAVKPGLDRALLVGLAAARQNGPLVATLAIDSRTRGARPVFPPFLAVLGDEGLGLDLLAREADGVTRRFSTLVPTEDGGFPTLAGRLCRALSKRCGDGFIHYALGRPFQYVPLQKLLDTQDAAWLERAFRDRIVLVGEARSHGDRIAVPVNYAGWERGAGRDAPAIVVHAQSLRTALLDAAPAEASRPWVMVLVGLAALVWLLRDWRMALVTGALAAVALLAAGVLALRAGIVVPLAAAWFTLALACAVAMARAVSRRFTIRRR
ncbi:MAG TPA: CHASE2 domain-containing protein [Usitatibacter sp.]|nr:CHASE2 domain-containing protein [Usitatibacter sp.]